ncbi:hypothetical protein FE782_31920, partial [Paenibacillus antri]
PADSIHDYNTGVPVPGNTGGLAKLGHTFAGWNTAADGSGTDYAAGGTLTIGAADVTLYAKWTVNQYAVNFESNGGSPVESQSISYGRTAAEPAEPTKTGYTFAEWHTDADLTAAFDFAAPIGAADITLYAKWTINSYTVTYDGNGSDGGTVPTESSHDYNTSVTVPGNPGGLTKTGHTFAGWNTAADGNGTQYATSDTFTIGAADVTLYAKWTINSYAVTYEGNGATSGDVPEDSSHAYNTDATAPGNPGGLAKTGHTFAGWNTAADGSGTNYAESDMFTVGAADVTLYAKWTINSYAVKYEGNGATSGDVPEDSSHVYNTDVTVPGNPGGLAKTGHSFEGWSTEANGSGTNYAEADTFTISASNVTLYAKWTINQYTVNFESNGGSPVDGVTVHYGSAAVKPTDPTKTGYAFAGWYTDRDALSQAFDFAVPIGAADVTLYAKWMVNQYTVSFESNGGSPVESQSINYGNTAAEPAEPTKTGYTFAEWYTDADLTAAFDFAAPIGAADITLYAKWTVNQYSVTFESNGGTPTTGQTIDYGTVVTEPVAPTKTGCTFAGWYTDADLTAAYDFASPIGAADLTLYAK